MDELKKRGHALEEKFFADQDAKAVAQLREKLAKQELAAALAEHTGIENAELLQSEREGIHRPRGVRLGVPVRLNASLRAPFPDPTRVAPGSAPLAAR